MFFESSLLCWFQSLVLHGVVIWSLKQPVLDWDFLFAGSHLDSDSPRVQPNPLMLTCRSGNFQDSFFPSVSVLESAGDRPPCLPPTPHIKTHHHPPADSLIPPQTYFSLHHFLWTPVMLNLRWMDPHLIWGLGGTPQGGGGGAHQGSSNRVGAVQFLFCLTVNWLHFDNCFIKESSHSLKK